jgi:hypothetical protein
MLFTNGVSMHRVWVQHECPTPITLLGYNLRTELSEEGWLTGAMMDAITRCNMQLDNITYRKVSRRWRHYLPASFAVSETSIP